MATNLFNFGPVLDAVRANTVAIIANQVKVLNNQVKIMALLDDLHAADAALLAAVNAAVALIQTLHTGGPGSVSDADVQQVITDMQTAASALSGAMPQP